MSRLATTDGIAMLLKLVHYPLYFFDRDVLTATR